LELTDSGAIVTIVAEQPKDLFCKDLYVIADIDNVFVKAVFIRGKHIVKIEGFKDNEKDDIIQNGLRIFRFQDNIYEFVIQAWGIYSLLNGKHLVEDNVKFLEKEMNYTFVERKQPNTPLDASQIQSGDFIGITR